MENKFDFSGWATKVNLKCSDGRVIMKDAFKHNDGKTVPLVWNHQHSDPNEVLGHALLENRDEGVYAYCTFNETESGQTAKLLVKHGDISALSIYANNLKQNMSNVIHGNIREVSLVLAGANPGAFIDSIMKHGEESDEEAIIYTGEDIKLFHSEDNDSEEDKTIEHSNSEEETDEMTHADSTDDKKDEKDEKEESKDEETAKDVYNSMNENQKTLLHAMIAEALNSDDEEDEETENDEGGNDVMKHNVFDNDEKQQSNVLTHSDEMSIIELAKNKSVGTFQNALRMYLEDNESLAHGIDNIESLFPDYQWTKPGAPEMVTRDQTWVDSVLTKVHKSPISRIRTRQADVRPETIRGMGYTKTKEKKLIGNLKLINRSTDPQTVYVKDKLERDDIIDITDFDVVDYQRRVMRMALNEEIATAIMIGDGRTEGDEAKIYETHIRPIWTDDELYTIHADVDIAKARTELQGTNTSANFGENYIYAEAIITAALYSREKYKGSGNLDFYCTPHLLNIMLLARDLNGRRIYDSKTDLAAALNVNSIHTVEQFENKTRTTEEDSKKKKLLGIFVNLADYQLGATKGGEITNFEDFDIDFNQYKYLMETRVSGALTKVFSAIALEETVEAPAG